PNCAYFFRPRIEDHALICSFLGSKILPKIYIFGSYGFVEKSFNSGNDFHEARDFSNADLLEFLAMKQPISPKLSGGVPIPAHRTTLKRPSILVSSPGEFNLQLEFEQRKVPGITCLFSCNAMVLYSFVGMPVFQNQLHSLQPALDPKTFKKQLLLEGGFTLQSWRDSDC